AGVMSERRGSRSHRFSAAALDDVAVSEDQAIEVLLEDPVGAFPRWALVTIREAHEAVPARLLPDPAGLEVDARRQVIGVLEVLRDVGGEERLRRTMEEHGLVHHRSVDVERRDLVAP